MRPDSEPLASGRSPTGGGPPAGGGLATLAGLNRAMRAGDVSSAALVEGALERAGAVEGWLRAFVWLDPLRARRLAEAADRWRDSGGHLGTLHGVPVGIKDIVDTAGIPTEHGSALFAGRVPAGSAALVVALEGAGAIVLGKTVTAEMAYFHPGPTANPWDRRHTPGGSSMGSAAAVAAGIVPVAVGTQTNGSVIRPAAFCGVVGFKPTAGRLSGQGMLTFSATLDQPGGFARCVADAAWLTAAMAGEAPEAWWAGDSEDAARPAPRLAVARTAEWEHATPAARHRFEEDVATLADAGAQVEEPPLPEGIDGALPLHRTIMAYEAAQSLGEAVERRPDLVSATLRAFLAEGAAVPGARYEAALRERRQLIRRFAAWAAPFDALLTPPATGEAPAPETTGDPRFCTRWTLVGAPALVVPTGLGPQGLPLGLQLVGARGADRRLLAAAAWAEAHLPHPGFPPIPRPTTSLHE